MSCVLSFLPLLVSLSLPGVTFQGKTQYWTLLTAGWHFSEGSTKREGRGGFSVHVIQANSPGESCPADLGFLQGPEDPQEAETWDALGGSHQLLPYSMLSGLPCLWTSSHTSLEVYVYLLGTVAAASFLTAAATLLQPLYALHVTIVACSNENV